MAGMGEWLSERSRNGGVDEVPLPSTAGHLWLCGKHFVGPDHLAAAQRVDADVVVCLCHRHELEDRYPQYAAWLGEPVGGSAAPLPSVARKADPQALWFPIHDLHAPPADQALELVGVLRGLLDAGSTLLVHCGAGVGRAGTLAAALLLSLGMGREEALALVAASRSMAGPEAGPQTDLLVELERRFRVRPGR